MHAFTPLMERRRALPLTRADGQATWTDPRSRVRAERRRLLQMLDAVDHGMLLLDGSARVLQMNKAARRDLDAQHPLALVDGHLQARDESDAPALLAALQEAALGGLRRLLHLGHPGHRGPPRHQGERASGAGDGGAAIAVLPLPSAHASPGAAVLVVLGKRSTCEELSVDGFARSHRLSAAETGVVKALCANQTPRQIALAQGVALSTVRSQISEIRRKTGAVSIGALTRQVALLPPLVHALGLPGTG